jgi:phosphohistidine swiveling domain-containing protein/DNA-binding Xre family transcriptional regulator
MAKLRLANVAKKLRKSAAEIARETKINRNTINALMKGDVEDVKISTLEKICKTYDLQMKDILVEDSIGESKTSQAVRKLYKQEGEIIPFTCWPWALVAGSFKINWKGRSINFGQLDLYFKGEYGIGYWDFNSLREIASSFFEIYYNKDQYAKLYSKYLVYSSEIENVYLESYTLNPQKLDNAQINSIFERINAAYRGFWECSLFIDTFDTGVDQEHIRQIAKEYSLDKKEVEVLTTPSEMTFADERKFELLTIIKNDLARTNTKDWVNFLERNKEVLERYRKKFDYHKSNYTYIKHIILEEIKEEVEKYADDEILLEREFGRLSQYEKNKRTEIDEVLGKSKLGENPLWFFSNLTYWREHRKKLNLMGIHVLDFVLSAIEEQTGISKKYLHYLSFDEVENVLKGLISSQSLEQRYKDGVLITILGDDYKIFEGAEADSIHKDLELILSGDVNDSKVITGQTASQGYAKGVARIILTQDDFARFGEGEILVTSMTRPEFVPLMKKSAAIVTNEGGITCHAAIVSRELGKPCVIGTKNATQLIQDGDLVEVRANHGTVRVLK